MKSFIFKSWLIFSVAILFTISSCVKDNFDAPPRDGVDPVISVDKIISVQELLSQYYVPGKFVDLNVDKYLKGIVVSDDKEGNIYKLLYIHDENSKLGMSLAIDETNMGNIYPVGRRVYVKLNGLTISDNNSNPQIGFGINLEGTRPALGRIPATLLAQSVIPGMYNIKVEPNVKTINTLGPNDVNTLVQLEGMQFVSIGDGVTYAPSDPPTNANVNITDCNNNVIILRNSGYSKFANQTVPSKNGTITAIYGVFGTTKQLFIRSTSDINFDKDRCGQSGGDNRISIKDLRSLFASGTTVGPAGFIQGVVISDGANGNTDTRNMVLQDGESGIVLRFTAAHNVALGREIKVNINGIAIAEFNGLLQIATVPNDNIQIIGAGTVTPKVLTISQINLAVHESTLVTLKDVELSGGATFGSNNGNITVTDATGSYTLFTRAAASFSSQPLKTGKVSLTAMVSEFNTPQLIMRKLEDVSGGGTVDPGNGIDEAFSGQSNNVDITIPGWENIAVKGTRKWQGKLFMGNLYAQSTAFNDTAPAMETWLITPEVNTEKTPTLTFESAKSFMVHEGLSVWATTNYTGNPTTTTWTKVNAKLVASGDADNTFISSGNIDLKPLGAKVKIGFKYEGAGGTNTSTFRLDNIKTQ